MQAEWLEKWIEENSRSEWNSSFQEGDCVSVADLRVLFAGKVLCNAEPVAWIAINGSHARVRGENHPQACVADQYRPLYAPASPLGNADIGKEGA
jgi:hypothetical protein